MRKTTLANLKTKTLKAFRNIFAHHKNAHAKISDWVFYIPVELHTQVRARIWSVVDPKSDEKRFTVAQVDSWQSMDVLTMLDVLIEPNAAALVDGNSLVAALENIELVPSAFFVSRYYETLEHQLSTVYRQFMLVYEDCHHEEITPQVCAMPWNAPSRSRLRVSAYKQTGCGIFDYVHQECFYRLHPYFNKEVCAIPHRDPILQLVLGAVYQRTRHGSNYAQGASIMLRKRSRQDDFAGLSGKSLGSERSVSRKN